MLKILEIRTIYLSLRLLLFLSLNNYLIITQAIVEVEV